jgi:hypothetical protein
MSLNPLFFVLLILLHKYKFTSFFFLNQADLSSINALDLQAVDLPAILISVLHDLLQFLKPNDGIVETGHDYLTTDSFRPICMVCASSFDIFCLTNSNISPNQSHLEPIVFKSSHQHSTPPNITYILNPTLFLFMYIRNIYTSTIQLQIC